MGLFKAWKEVKAAASAAIPSVPANTTGTTGVPQRGAGRTMAGLAATMMQMMAPMLMAMAPERGKPLPGTEPGVLEPEDPASLQAGIAALQARDSAFDPQVLTTFAEQLFGAVASCWGTGDPAGVRALLSDEIWNPFGGALGSGMAAGLGTILAHQQARATLVGTSAGEAYDSALFSLAVDIVGVPHDPNGKIPPESYHWPEEWLLQRSVLAGGDPMIVVDRCPSCGAPTTTDSAGRCTHCHQYVPVRTSGWLVTAIRAHNPTVEKEMTQMVDQARQNPEMLQMVPDEMLRLFPRDTVASIDPQRAAAVFGTGA
ncbi:MAG TPA: hypothetical protein VF070_24710 [Streptosporangiaceae bacterium]